MLPWLCLYLVAILSLIVACAIYFKSMGMMKPIAVAVVILLTYFYAIIAAFFHELVFEEREKAQDKKTAEKDTAGKDACLIALDDVGHATEAGDASILTNGRLVLRGDGDDTFTDLASRPKLLDTNPFKEDVDGRQDSSDDERTVDDSRAPFLPRPDEVILVDTVPYTDGKPDDVIVAVDEADATASTLGSSGKSQQQSWFESPFRPACNISKSSDQLTPAHKPKEALNTIDETRPADVLPTTASSTLAIHSSSRPRASRSHSHSGLLGDIDASFTPFKSGAKRHLDGQEVQQTPPKMKVFLPKGDEDEDEEESSDNSLSEDEAAKPLDVSALST